MKLFARPEPTPVEKAIAARDAPVAKRERLATQLSQTRDELTRVKAAAAAAALRESALEVSEISGAVAQCAAAAEALSAALAVADDELKQAEATLAREQDLELRAESVRTIAEIIQAINAAVPTITVGVDERAGGPVPNLDKLVNLDDVDPRPPPAEPERWLRPFAEPKWAMPTGEPPRAST